MSLSLYSEQVILPEGIKPATLFIEDGKIVRIEDGLAEKVSEKHFDYGSKIIMSGIIDAHVHINDPGRNDWEGFETATKAAAANGTTTLIDMPLNSSPVTCTTDAFDRKIAASANNLYVNCGFWGGVIPSNDKELLPLVEKGVLGFKAFMIDSGLDEFPASDKATLLKAMKIIAPTGLPLLVHAEVDNGEDFSQELREDPQNYQAYLKSRPSIWEERAIDLIISLCAETKCKTHIVHLSAASALYAIQRAKGKGLPLTVETCAQYLYFDGESIPNGKTVYKCAPPIRNKENNDELWKALQTGLIDFVTTDHSPAPPALKEIESGNFLKAWGGIAGLQFLLPAVWTQAKKRGFTVHQIWQLLSRNPAHFLQLNDRKGYLKKGYDADIIVWDDDTSFIISEEQIQFKHKISPYIGETMIGKVIMTLCNGSIAYQNQQLQSTPVGQAILV